MIAAKRHVHLDPETAEKIGVKDKEIVSVKIDNPGRALVFGDVVIRVSPSFRPAMHIDTDEANAGRLLRRGLGRGRQVRFRSRKTAAGPLPRFFCPARGKTE